jgi:hypothetical protein
MSDKKAEDKDQVIHQRKPMKMGFTPIALPSVQEDKNQFRYHGKPIKMGFTPVALPSFRSIIPQ